MAKRIEVGKDISQEEMKRVEQQREFDKIPPNTLSYKIALLNDPIIVQRQQIQLMVQKRLLNIRQMKDKMFRLRAQLLGGVIQERLRDDLTMNEYEVTTEIRHIEYLSKTEAFDVVHQLQVLRAYVGRLGLRGDTPYTEEDHDQYCLATFAELKELGHEVALE